MFAEGKIVMFGSYGHRREAQSDMSPGSEWYGFRSHTDATVAIGDSSLASEWFPTQNRGEAAQGAPGSSLIPRRAGRGMRHAFDGRALLPRGGTQVGTWPTREEPVPVQPGPAGTVDAMVLREAMEKGESVERIMKMRS
jgi:hypothetical protein